MSAALTVMLILRRKTCFLTQSASKSVVEFKLEMIYAGAATGGSLLHPGMQAGQSQGMASFGPSRLSGVPGTAKGMAQPLSGPSSAMPHAFMPMMQQPGNAMQPGLNQVPSLHNGTAYPMTSSQAYHYTAAMPSSQSPLQNRHIVTQFPKQSGQPVGSQASHAGSAGTLDQGTVTSAQCM